MKESLEVFVNDSGRFLSHRDRYAGIHELLHRTIKLYTQDRLNYLLLIINIIIIIWLPGLTVTNKIHFLCCFTFN